jgi:hypothetical protein
MRESFKAIIHLKASSGVISLLQSSEAITAIRFIEAEKPPYSLSRVSRDSFTILSASLIGDLAEELFLWAFSFES